MITVKDLSARHMEVFKMDQSIINCELQDMIRERMDKASNMRRLCREGRKGNIKGFKFTASQACDISHRAFEIWEQCNELLKEIQKHTHDILFNSRYPEPWVENDGTFDQKVAVAYMNYTARALVQVKEYMTQAHERFNDIPDIKDVTEEDFIIVEEEVITQPEEDNTILALPAAEEENNEIMIDVVPEVSAEETKEVIIEAEVVEDNHVQSLLDRVRAKFAAAKKEVETQAEEIKQAAIQTAQETAQRVSTLIERAKAKYSHIAQAVTETVQETVVKVNDMRRTPIGYLARLKQKYGAA